MGTFEIVDKESYSRQLVGTTIILVH